MFDNKGICDFFQSQCLVLGTTPELVADNFWFESPVECPGQAPCLFALDAHWPGRIHKGFAHAEEPNERWVVEPKVKLVDICIRIGLVPSKNEFRRKCQQKGLKFDNKPVTDFNMEIDVTEPVWTHEIRLGKRFLELVINTVQREQTDEDHGA